jgi:Double zinc ribbon
VSDPEPRCPNCGALVSAEAEWCGQCYEPLRHATEPPLAPAMAPADAKPEPVDATPEAADRTAAREPGGIRPSLQMTVDVAGIELTESGTVWTCPGCEQKNPMALSTCPVCGTPFARLFQEPETTPHVEPGRALALSLVLPGLGHWKLGRKGDAVARIVLFVWSFGSALMLAFVRSGKGLGPLASLFLLFIGSTLILWLVSALDAYRIASDERPFVSARKLLWASAGLIVVSTVIATLVALPAARGQ